MQAENARRPEEDAMDAITDDIKARIFGLNAAGLYKIDPDEARCTLPGDQLAQVKLAYDDVRAPSLRTYGPKTRREFLNLAFNGRPDPRKRG